MKFILKSQKYFSKQNYVEIVGMPASGKSFFVQRLVESNKNLIDINSQLPSRKNFRQIVKLQYIFRLLIKNPTRFIKDTLIIISSRQKSFKDMYSVLSNWHLIVYLYEKNRNNDGMVYAWDQGLFQAIWSIYFSSQTDFDALKLIENKEFSGVIYYLDIDDEELRLRDKARIQSVRLNYDSNEQIKLGRDALVKTLKLMNTIGYVELTSIGGVK